MSVESAHRSGRESSVGREVACYNATMIPFLFQECNP